MPPRFHLLAAATAALLATLALLACTSDGTPPSRSPTPTPEVIRTPEATQTLEPTSTPRLIAPTPTATPKSPVVGMTVLQASGVGEHYTVYDGHSRLIDDQFPRFTSDGAVWYSPTDETAAFRWDSTARATEAIEGAWGVTESADGLTRSYNLRSDDGPTHDLVAIRGDLELTTRGDYSAHVLSPDGLSLAAFRWENGANSLVVFDLAGGRHTTLATDIDTCDCRNPPPLWSPSGAYLAYTDFGNPPTDEADRGGFVVAVDRAVDPIEVGDIVGWLATDEGDRLVAIASGVLRLVDPATGERHALALPEVGVRFATLTAGATLLDVAANDSDGVTRTLLLDPLTSEILGSWEGDGPAAMTPDGPAFASTNTEGCAGTRLDHPALDEPACFDGADVAVWSPDGRLLALRGDSRQSTDDWVEIWDVAADFRYRFEVPPDSRLLGWSPDSIHLLVIWGSGV